MSYYDEPSTLFNARIASERSAIVDLKYTYKKVINSLISLSPEDISDDLIQKQLDIVQQLRERRVQISNLENQLILITEANNAVVPQEGVDLSNNELPQEGVDLSNNEVPQEGVDLSNNEVPQEGVDLSNNEVPQEGVDLSNNEV